MKSALVFCWFVFLAGRSFGFDLCAALGGGDDRKIALARHLSGCAHVLFTGEPEAGRDPHVTLRDLYRQFGIPAKKQVPAPWISRSTADDMRVLDAVMRSRRWKSLEVFDSCYHVGRSKALYSFIHRYRARVSWVCVGKK